MAVKLAFAGTLALVLAGCDTRLGARDLGKPVAPSAGNPTGSGSRHRTEPDSR
jgi:hypothetical protein